MGRVYSPLEVGEGLLPQPGAHELAGRYIMQTLFVFEMQEVRDADKIMIDHEQSYESAGWPRRRRTEGEEKLRITPDGGVVNELNQPVRLPPKGQWPGILSIRGGMVYGSTALGCATVRSDVDLLITYQAVEDRYQRDLPALLRVVKAAEQLHNVKVELSQYAFQAFGEPYGHAIDPLFARHLVAVQEQREPQWSAGWPVDGLRATAERKLDKRQLGNLALRYAAGKERMLCRALVDLERTDPTDSFQIPNSEKDAQLHNFQRALELPSALIRKVIPFIDGHTDSETATNPQRNDGESAAEVVAHMQTYKNMFDGDGRLAVKQFVGLYKLDREYTELIESARDSGMTAHKYRDWLVGNYRTVLYDAHSLARWWSEHFTYQSHEPGIVMGNPFRAFDMQKKKDREAAEALGMPFDDDIY